LCGHSTAKRAGIDVVDEGSLAVDLDDRQPFAIRRFQFGVAADVDLLEVEGDLGAGLGDDGPRALAEVAALRVVQRDPGYG
jgi:hypothetical protein